MIRSFRLGFIIFGILIRLGSGLFCNTSNTKLNNSLRARIIAGHNDRRSLLAEGNQILADGSFNIPAVEILPLKYDCDIEAEAQFIANDYCVSHNVNAEGQSFNSNTFAVTNQSLETLIDQATQAWWEAVNSPEFAYLSYTAVYKGRGDEFARMAWAQTEKFGCGFQLCNGVSFIICVYKDLSVMPGQKIYEPVILEVREDPTQATNGCDYQEEAILWDSVTTESTPFTTVVSRYSTTQYATDFEAFPTSSYATITPTNEDEYPTTPRSGCSTSASRTTRIDLAGTPSGTQSPAVSPLTNFTVHCNSTDTPLTPALRQIFLDKHNSYRSQLANGNAELPDGTFAPPAANMYKMQYSCELEEIAQEWADRCLWEHSPLEHRNGGENLYMLTSGAHGAGHYMAHSVANSNDLWWAELKQYGGITRKNVTLTMEVFKTGIGHWAQMAWGDSRAVGCGFRECPKHDGSIMHFIVCNYRPTGNILNRNIYTIGSPCVRDSDCTSYDDSKCEVETGLCYL